MDNVTLINLALQSFGNLTTLTAAQLAAESNNEAKQANLCFANTRDTLLRMAPWDCAMKTANLQYITSVPGTPENTSPATNLWQPGQPRPPWAYEYQYPVDCLRACWIIPATQTGYAGGVPITTAVTGGAPTLWNGGPIRFKIGIDTFRPVVSVIIVSGGTGYFVGEEITLPVGPTDEPPIGGPAVLRVLTAPGGVVTSVEVVSQLIDADPPFGGSYFDFVLTNQEQASSTGTGTGFICSLSFGATKGNQRVILTNQEFATLVYVRQVTDPNVWDPMFQDAFIDALGANLCFALTGDKGLANARISLANNTIMEARKADGNEGLTINDHTPDWIRARGINWTDNMVSGPYAGFEWGSIFVGW